MVIKHILKLIACCSLSAAAAYFVPTNFSFRATFTVKGETGSIETLPTKMELRLLEEIRKKNISSLRASKFVCIVSKENSNQLVCSSDFSSRSSGKKAEDFFERLPKSFGWISMNALRSRMDLAKADLDKKTEEMNAIDAEMKSIPAQDQKLDKAIADLMLQKNNLEKESQNKRSQLQMVQDAIPKQTVDKEAFVAKEKELLKNLDELRKSSELVDQKLTELGSPFEKLHELEQKKESLKNASDVTMAKLVQMSSIVETYQHEDKIPDPETFQLTEIKSNEVIPVRSLGTLSWSIIVGCFLYGLAFHPLRKRIKSVATTSPASPLPSPTYTTAELEDILKTPYLGKIQVRHTKDIA